MSAYIPVELQQKVRTHFRNCCAYCRTAEALTVVIFEFEHIILAQLVERQRLRICAFLVRPVIATKLLSKPH